MSLPFQRRILTRRRLAVALLVSLAALALAGVAALLVGQQSVLPGDLWALATGTGHDPSIRTIIVDIRLPRIVLAISAGAALAGAGALFQALLRNPLAEPYILGVSNGGVVGAIIGYLLGAGPFVQPLLAFAGGAIVVAVVLGIARGTYGLRSESMLLGGAMVAAIGSAIIFLLLHLLGPQLRSAIQWTLGDLSTAQAGVGYASGILFVLLLALSLGSGNALNALSLGDEEAASLGMDVPRARGVGYLVGSFIVGVTVAFCGAIGFVGLVVPHIVRRLVGPDHRVMGPLAVTGGALFLLGCDTAARSLMPALDSTGSELPVGAVTALLGAPMFIYLLRRGAASAE